MAENTVTAVEEVPSELVAQGQGETGLTPAQVKVLAATLLKGLAAPEMGVVFHQAKEYGLSIFRKEIWGFQAKGKLVTMVSRDGLQKIAARHPAYGGIVSAIVYEKDELELDLGSGSVKHVPARSARGKAQGAWAKVIRKGYEPLTVFITVDEVRQSFWSDRQAADMVLVRAEARALRRADVGTGGVYLEEEFDETKELAQVAPARVEEVQEKAKEAAETVRKKRKAAKDAVAAMPAPAAQAIEEAAQPEAKAFEDTDAEDSASEVETVKEIWAAWLDDRLPKNVLENRRANVSELFRFLGAELGAEIGEKNLGDLDAAQKENALAAIRDRNADMLPEEKPAVIMASRATVDALAKAMGGESWLKKAMRRAFGHDNAYALTQEQAEQLKKDLHPAHVQAVDATLAQVAEKEQASGQVANASTVDKLKAAWADPSLNETALSVRTPAALDFVCEKKLGRPGATVSNLTPTEAERMLTLVLERNAECPKKS